MNSIARKPTSKKPKSKERLSSWPKESNLHF